MNRKINFDNNWLQWALFLLAVAVKATLLRTYLTIDGDRGLQFVAAIQMAKGYGYTIPVVELSDINLVLNKVLLEWPPLYSSLIAGLLKPGLGYVAAATVVDTMGAFLYLLGTWWLARFIGFSAGVRMLIIWFKATEIYEGLYSSPPTDFLSTAGILMAVYFFLKWIDNEKWKYILLTGICFSFAFLLRYVYVTTLFVLPLLLIWNGWKKAKPKYYRAGVLLAVIVGASLVGYLGFNKIQTGHFTYLEEWSKGFFPGKVLNPVPLFWQAITHVTFVCMQFSLIFGTHFSLFHNFLKLTSVLILLFMLINWMKNARPWQLVIPADRYQQLLLSSALLMIPYVGILLYLSVRVEFFHEDAGWSYLVEDRYYLYLLTIILLVICRQLFQVRWKNNSLQGLLKRLLLVALVFQSAHTFYVISRRAPLIVTADPTYPQGAGWPYLDRFTASAKKVGNEVVIFSNNYGFSFYALQNDIQIYRQTRQLRADTKIKLRKPTTVILELNKAGIKEMVPFLDRYRFQPRQVFNNYIFFVAHLKPSAE